MNNYEVMLIFSGKLSDLEMKKAEEKILKSLLGEKGKVLKEEKWGLKNFEYPINKEVQGYYNIFYVNIDPKILIDFKYLCKISPEVLRVLVLKHEKKMPYEMNLKVKNKLPIKRGRRDYSKNNPKLKKNNDK